MSEKSRAETQVRLFKGVATVVGGVALATGNTEIALATTGLTWSADFVDFMRNEAVESIRSFANNLVTTHDADKGDQEDLRKKLESKPGVKTTVAALRTLFDLIDDAAEPALRRLALDYVVAQQKPDAFFRCLADMLTHCDASDIQGMRSVFSMLIDEPEEDVTLVLGISSETKGEKTIVSAGGTRTIGFFKNTSGSAASDIVKSTVVADPQRLLRLLDDYRIAKVGKHSRVSINSTGYTITRAHAGYLLRAFTQP